VLYQTPVGFSKEAEILLISSSFSLALMFNAKATNATIHLVPSSEEDFRKMFFKNGGSQ
jgi:hypothetical protein